MRKYFLFIYLLFFLSSNAQIFVKIKKIKVKKGNQMMIRYELKNDTKYNYIINHNLIFNSKCSDFENYTYIQMMDDNLPIHISCFRIENYIPKEKYDIVKSFSSIIYNINTSKVKNNAQKGVNISLIYSKVNSAKIILNQRSEKINKLDKRFIKFLEKGKIIYYIGKLESENFNM